MNRSNLDKISDPVIKNVVEIAIKTAKRKDIPLSSGYDIARDLWGLYWKYKSEGGK